MKFYFCEIYFTKTIIFIKIINNITIEELNKIKKLLLIILCYYYSINKNIGIILQIDHYYINPKFIDTWINFFKSLIPITKKIVVASSIIVTNLYLSYIFKLVSRLYQFNKPVLFSDDYQKSIEFINLYLKN